METAEEQLLLERIRDKDDDFAIRNASACPDAPRKVNFFADHPFVYLIGESTSGTILFEGVYAGE